MNRCSNRLIRTLSLLAVPALLASAFAAAPSPALAAPAPAAQASGDPMYKQLADKATPAIVKVKMLLKGGPLGDQSRENEVDGLMIEADGLVLVSNTLIGGMAARMGGGGITPSDVKVLIGDDTEGLKARVLARDSELDLAWVKIDDEKASGKSFTAIDLNNSAEAAIGDKLYSLSRMGKFFGQVTTVSEGNVAAVASKPRKLIVPSATVVAPFGLPAFSADGKCVGVFIVQMPDDDEMSGMRGGGFEGPMILPASEVVAATKRAKEAPQPAEEPAPEPAAEPGAATP